MLNVVWSCVSVEEDDLPVSTETALRLFCVSLHPQMTEQENEYIAAALWDAVERTQEGDR